MSKDNNSIIRVQKDKSNPYVMLNKTFLSDDRLSWKSKGILAYLLSKPDNWQVKVYDLVAQSTDGETAVYSGLKELKEFGYLERFAVYEKGKIHHWESIVYEVAKGSEPEDGPGKKTPPTTLKTPIVENPQVLDNSGKLKTYKGENLLPENHDVENLDLENRDDLIINNINNNYINKLNTTTLEPEETKPGPEPKDNDVVVDLNSLKSEIEKTINDKFDKKLLNKLVKSKGINAIKNTLAAWDKIKGTIKSNAAGKFYVFVVDGYTLPTGPQQPTSNNSNFEQRKYDDEFFNRFISN
jgi:hypothetical protein